MTIDAVIKSSRDLLKFRPWVDRVKLFSRRGVSDPWEFPSKISDYVIKATSVHGGIDVSVLQIVRNKIAIPIFIENLIFAENPSLIAKYQGEMGDNESVSYVEKKCIGRGLSYYTIICVSKTRCAARFSICKELMHIYTDQVQRIKHAEKMLEKALEWRNCVSDRSKGLKPETACFYHAVEVMLPWDFREKQFLSVTKRYAQDEDCNKKIAISFMIPRSVISHILEAPEGVDMSYLNFSKKVNSVIDKRDKS